MESYARYLAASWFQKHVRRLGNQLPGIRRAEDIECVHRARVACRRLRAGLAMFPEWPSAKRHLRWEKQIRRLGRRLGEARDKDVQISFLADLWPQAPCLEVRVGLAGLILYRQTERQTAYQKATKGVAQVQKSRLVQEIASQSRRVLRELSMPEEELLYCPLWQQAAENIQALSEELLRYAPSLQQNQEEASHHAMRITAKKLRYSLEILTPLFGPDVQPILSALEEFQTLMGQLHDCQVWLLELGQLQKGGFLKKIRKQWNKAGFGSDWTVRAFAAALQWLQQDRQNAQERLLQEAAGFWRQRLQEQITDRLPAVVQRALLRPAKRRGLLVRQSAMG
ncbi:MAG: CHAD domain-containing protein [Thermoguttaceae bacterium]|nr:CHAD domain-containing protein [Thermoguttaceae bacterium]MDW8036775.1 CHAD domain-containing protein [Thermoguttaceae bacterium]